MELDQYLHGELSPHRRRELAGHLRGCARCQAWLSFAEQHAEGHARTVDSPTFARRIVQRYTADRPGTERPAAGWIWSWLRRPAVLSAAAAACVLLLALAIWSGGPPDHRAAGRHVPGENLVKGSTSVRLHCRRGSRVFVLQPDHRVAAGDAIRFEVYGGGAGYVLVLGLQGDGQISTYVPFDGERSVPIATNRAVTMPGSIILDDSTADELLVVLFSRAPLKAPRARAALRAAFDSARGDLAGVGRLDLAIAGQHLRLLERQRN
jgi:hypothetical protein